MKKLSKKDAAFVKKIDRLKKEAIRLGNINALRELNKIRSSFLYAMRML